MKKENYRKKIIINSYDKLLLLVYDCIYISFSHLNAALAVVTSIQFKKSR